MDEIKSNDSVQNNESNNTPNENNSPNPAVPRDIRVIAMELVRRIGHFLHDITDIREGQDEQGTRDSIQKNIQIKGSNIWLLMSAIMVASLGLNLNSPAVIIGAMLISPLMSPILGIGLSVSINDRKTLYQSIYHFAVAIGVSLATSTLYFLLTPLSGEATSEIIARTSPTILDVFVAFFGGIAGIVSGSRLEKSNAIPGVAIATALLPPLCVSGYGLANGEWSIFLNSLYLFFLNSVFIAFATYIVVKFVLGFRPKKYVDSTEQKRSNFMILAFVLLIITPSIFILTRVIKEERVKYSAKEFVQTYFDSNDRNIDWEFKPILNNGEETDSLLLKISVFGDTISSKNIESYQRLLPENNLHNVLLKVIQIHIPNIKEFNKKEKAVFSKEKESYQQILNEKNAQIQALNMQVSILKSGSQVLKGLELLDPQIEETQFGPMTVADSTQRVIPSVNITWKPKTSKRYMQKQSERIGVYIRNKMELDTIQVFSQF